MAARFLKLTLTALLILHGLIVAAAAMEVVHFKSAAPPAAGQSSGSAIWGHLKLPDGPGPFPAVVLMHGCGGILEAHIRWASELNAAGFATLIVDSFRPRSILNVCKGDTTSTGYSQRAFDAHGALAYLQARPDIEPDNIGVIGWSHGATAALEAVSEGVAISRLETSFSAAIAFYPYCLSDRNISSPTIILIGENDDWTPPEPCEDLADRNRSNGSTGSVEVITYPAVYHSFDKPEVSDGFFVEGPLGIRHLMKYDRQAHDDSIRRVKAFLSQHVLSKSSSPISGSE